MRGHLIHTYVIAIGSNVRHHGIGRPRDVVRGATQALAEYDVDVLAASDILATAPLGPSRRRYANGAILIETGHDPQKLLAICKEVEAIFGNRRGQRWTARVLDLDIVFWSGGAFGSPDLCIPHPQFRERTFVLGPVASIAPDWRDPISGLTVRQLHHRLTRPMPLPR